MWFSVRVTSASETALLLACPQALPVITDGDGGAAEGPLAHVTVLYPFKPPERLDDDDHRTLAGIFGATDPFVLRGSRTGWFDERVLYVAPDDPVPILALTGRVIAAYPDLPPYGGEFAEVVPHLTVAMERPVEELRAAEQRVRGRLPFEQHLDHVELWTGPAIDSTEGAVGWQRIRSYEFRPVVG